MATDLERDGRAIWRGEYGIDRRNHQPKRSELVQTASIGVAGAGRGFGEPPLLSPALLKQRPQLVVGQGVGPLA
ncbi:MAG TPA: hypothetical protein VGH49_07690, partial [Xanthobacteraceae bacterium]